MPEHKQPGLPSLISEIHGNQQAPGTHSSRYAEAMAVATKDSPQTEAMAVPNGKRFMTMAELSRPRQEGEIDLARPLLVKIHELGLTSKYAGALPLEFTDANAQYQRHLFNLATRIVIASMASKWFVSDDSIEKMCDWIDSTLTQGADFKDHNLWLTSVMGLMLPEVAKLAADRDDDSVGVEPTIPESNPALEPGDPNGDVEEPMMAQES